MQPDSNSTPLPPDLHQSLQQVARTPVLLVATDYDGTLAPIVADPARAEAHRESIVALKALAAMPQTHIAVISGRALADLARHVAGVEDAHLVGSHGSEFEAGFIAPLPPDSTQRLRQIVTVAQSIAAKTPGATVEVKPAGIAFHYRNADPDAGPAAALALQDAVRHLSDLHFRHGKMVLEISVIATSKGIALQRLRQRLGATAVVFIGDDVTDEDAFATLSGPDVGIKVGEGDSAAKFRLADPINVARFLAQLVETRAQWITGTRAVPIDAHALLSDQRTCALVTPGGRISWLCFPRIDSPALFADLLGGPSAGFFEIAPASGAAFAPRQQYLGASMVLSTDWGAFRVTDYLDASAGRPYQRAGRSDLIRVIEGSGKVRITFAPRLSFGAVETRLSVTDAGLRFEGAVEPCVLHSPGLRWNLSHEGLHDVAICEMDLPSTPLVLELRWGTANLMPQAIPEKQRREQTLRFWQSWAATLVLPDCHRALVERSALALRALVYGPTGAIAAAATTSLPEQAGGVRNWDYRFCWPRDAALAAAALLRLQSSGAAMKFLDWMLALLEASEPGSLVRPLYTVTGGHLGPEGVIPELAGYRGSRPVRIGNGAAHQVQLDVLGPIAELLALMAKQGASLTQEHWRLMDSMVLAVSKRWQEADHGIWEIRSDRRHHVHSKVMCWQTVDCAIQVADYLGRKSDGWLPLRNQIASDVLTHGWNPSRNTFCASYGSDDIDASTLCVGLSGLLPPEDPRFAATVAAIERELLENGTVYRYRYDDGLPGIEGGFNLCTAWLMEAYTLLGRWSDAESLFETYISRAGPTGLLSEEFDPVTNQCLGNFPQAYSHIGLINTAFRLAAHRPG